MGYIILLFSFDKFAIQIIPIYKDVRRVQKCMKKYQIKSELNVFKRFNYNKLQSNRTISYIYSPTISNQLYGEYILTVRFYTNTIFC
jgi:hypothetical protein